MATLPVFPDALGIHVDVAWVYSSIGARMKLDSKARIELVWFIIPEDEPSSWEKLPFGGIGGDLADKIILLNRSAKIVVAFQCVLPLFLTLFVEGRLYVTINVHRVSASEVGHTVSSCQRVICED